VSVVEIVSPDDAVDVDPKSVSGVCVMPVVSLVGPVEVPNP
jgi:hypothetical protein